jgi:sarcosine oxidase, subunit alpha
VSAYVEARTTLHRRHLELGAVMEPLGAWSRPRTYGDVEAEYWAVRRSVSVMDVGTLGKFLVFGRDAEELLDRLYPVSVRDIAEGRARYTPMLNEYGYVVDDGLVCRLERDRFYVTFASSGATGAEAMMRGWADTWGLDVFVLDETVAKGTINVCGPQARVLLERLTDAPLSKDGLPYLRHCETVVAGVACRVIRLGFVGELSFELHHPSSGSVALWDALLEAGSDLGVVPHGTDALRTLRLEKGHLIVGQDTDLDASPDKVGLAPLVRMEKPDFVGKAALEGIFGRTPRRRLCALEFPGERAPVEGAPVLADGRQIGHLTSSRFSPVLGKGVALGWVQTTNGTPPAEVVVDGIAGTVVEHTFYDPEGLRVRA